MDQDKLELIGDFSSYFETTQNFPPLISKIYAYLLLDCSQKGTTFDELVEVFNASKSSISNGLNFLTQLKHIEYFTKIDDRKRFYRIVPENLMLRLENIQKMLSTEKELTQKLKNYKIKMDNEDNDLSTIKTDIYIDHLKRAIEQLSITVEKLKTLTKNS